MTAEEKARIDLMVLIAAAIVLAAMVALATVGRALEWARGKGR